MKSIKIILLIFISNMLFAQTKEDLKKQKLDIEKDILYTTKLLEKTKQNKTKSLDYLKVLERQISMQEKLLRTMSTEIKLLNKDIKKTKENINKTKKEIENSEEELQKLKEEYAKIIYSEFKKRSNSKQLVFIISSDDFSQAYNRLIYLKQYSDFRIKQAKKITAKKQQLKTKQVKLDQQKILFSEDSLKTSRLIKVKKEELTNTEKTKKEKDNLLKKLIKSEKTFKKKLQDQEKKSKDLDRKIKQIIKEEIEKSKNKKSYGLTPESLALSKDFMKNKGKLPWPILRGIIVNRHGKQPHPVLAGITIQNNGVDFATEKNTEVRAVFDGVISRIFFVKGTGKAVLINHGEYFTLYSGLKTVTVKENERVFLKEKIGIVKTDSNENKTQLHFEIWQGNTNKNPSDWLYNAD